MTGRFWALASMMGSAGCATVAGCGGDGPASAVCPESNLVRGVCAGVPAGDVCDDETCTEGVACSSVVEVASDDELASAAEAAVTGTCIALLAGRYGMVSVPGSVSLLGRSADAVEVQGIVLAAGEGAVVRGLSVAGEGVSVQGATGVRIASVRVRETRSGRPGVEVASGSSVTIVASEIAGPGHAGIFAVDAAVTVERSVVSGAQRGGIDIQGHGCDPDCACTSRPALLVKSSVIRSNHIIGVSLRGASASLEDVDVIDTLPGAAFETGYFGGGISVAECSSVLGARKVRVLESTSFGILVDRSTAALGDEGEEDSIEISRNKRGLWIQNVCQTGGAGCVTLHNGKLDGNLGVGIGIAGQSRSIILCKSAVTATRIEQLPVYNEMDEPAFDDVGDGVDWLDGSEVVIEELTLSDNARQSLLIDGPAGGSIEALHFTGGAGTTPVQQNVMVGDEQPEAEGTTLTIILDRSFTIPQSPGFLSPE
ncbi:right-handed parallel beta-helix repeat-containing protein [Sorangium sp. So ce1099]|uniref:right-handed parallel beta-helix repeat-containing protein n=1 Tax=Sorangium sp. So ce1099 TaxID=3133331 RepID=UPI003F5EC453